MSDWVDDVEPLAAAPTKRLMDLVLLLQSSKRGFTREEIFSRIEGYRGESNEDSTARKFERDKNSLLSVGVMIEGHQPDPMSPESYRYRVVPDRALLPELTFSPGERLALRAALAAWGAADHLAEARAARLKLEALGVELPEHGTGVELTAAAGLDTLMSAIAERRAVRFSYRKPGDSSPSERTLEAWGVACRRGNFFVYGFDRDRGEVRVFNLHRVTAGFKAIGKEGDYEIPDSVDVSELLDPQTPSELQTTVRLRLAAGKGAYWRRRIGTAEALSMNAGDFDFELANPYSMIPLLAADSPGVVVLAPTFVRDLVARMVGVGHGAS